VHLAPPDYHLLVEKRRCLSLSIEEPVRFSRPSIDVLFETAADAYGPALLGLLLAGANDDGARGLARIREAGGATVVQSPDTSTSRVMPEAALRRNASHHVLPLGEIGPFLARLGARAIANATPKETA
jgi:two-component system chemotaxis response regulator CheB